MTIRAHFLRSILAASGLVGTVVAQSPVPPPASAYIQKLAAHPTDDSVLYAATNGAGLYRSINAGDHWRDISPAATQRHYNIVVFDPREPATLFTGGRDSGLWVSPDEGRSWSLVAFEGKSILSLVIDPRDSQRLHLLLPDGVYRSTSGPTGEWHLVFDYPDFVANQMAVPWPNPDWPVQLGRFQHLTLDPHDPDILYLGARWEGGYHRSEDGGDTWRHESIGPIFRRADRVVVDPIHSHVLYAETHHQGMFKSYNRGRSWVSASQGLEPQKRTPHYGAVLISGSAFDPTDAETIYAGSDYSNWKTTDGATTWHELGNSLTCEFARSFLVTSQAVYAGTNVGIYRSFDEGKTWETCNRGLPPREVLDSVTGQVGSETFEFAVVRGRPAVFRRPLDSASDWVSISWLLYENATAISFESESETLIIETPHGKRRSTDAGLRWDVPATVYVDQTPANPPRSVSSNANPPSGYTAIPFAIHGVPHPDDTQIDSWYQRPPYIALAIVGPGYPYDGSEPFWTGHWESQLAGTITVPDTISPPGSYRFLRVEVRDFLYGTRVGSAPLTPHGVGIISVSLRPVSTRGSSLSALQETQPDYDYEPTPQTEAE